MRLKKTSRGFKCGGFLDIYGRGCSIQESSLATSAALWLGIDEYRMHLDKRLAKQLIRHLQKFVVTGEL